VVTRQDKRLALGRLGSLVEQIEALVSKDRQVILVRPSSAPRCLCGCRRRCGAAARCSAAGSGACRGRSVWQEFHCIRACKSLLQCRMHGRPMHACARQRCPAVQHMLAPAAAAASSISITLPTAVAGDQRRGERGAAEAVPPADSKQQPAADADTVRLAYAADLRCVRPSGFPRQALAYMCAIAACL